MLLNLKKDGLVLSQILSWHFKCKVAFYQLTENCCKFSIRLNRPTWAGYFFARTIEKLSQFGIEQYYSVITNSKPGNELMPFYWNGSLSIKFVFQSTSSVQYLQFLSYQINLNWDNNHNHTAGWPLNTTLIRF